ncbi:glycerophosphodiester phosphodiesterase [Actinosynnema pretiosum]|uniref:Glycerophosphodiester phosphodiesterase n=1 Tax=Actinosynnema pretiosum TaxID=42197 RepID=A0A290Z720_9PSEU|nr:glycerophosphodiester phosphodiesterase [Actinosynnema pretiosum]ATE54820.1 glycerophosphodiester phosphodiesterase [Actinosynnema pretiosum]
MKLSHRYLSGPNPRAFAHRGWHLGELEGMENSLSAMRRAVAEGFSYLETDVHTTSDGVVVVHHDSTLDRTTDGTGVVSQLPWARVREARVGGREPVVRLEELMEELPGAFLNIDVKSDAAVAPVVELLRRTGALGRVCLASFSDARLARLRRLLGPELLTSMGPRSVAALWAGCRLPGLAAAARGVIAQVPVNQGRLTVVDARFVRAAHRRGGEVHVWTVDEADEMRRLLDLGVDGLVSDRPDVLREVLRERGAWTAT